MPLLIGLLVFLGVAGVVLWLALPRNDSRREEQIRRRLEAIDKARRRSGTSAELELLRNELLSDVPALHRFLSRWVVNVRVRKFIAQAGLEAKPGKLFLLSGVLGFGAFLATQFFLASWMLALLAGLLAGLAPAAYVAFRRSRRLHAFEVTFPEAIDLLGRAVRAGHAFTTGLEMIARELPEPVATEFRTTFDEQNFGLPLKDVLLNFADRMPLLDVRFFVVALIIQKETGGNLAEILDNLSHVIRERFKIYGEVKTKTAHGRMTAGILMVLPIGMMILLEFMNPDYLHLLFSDPMGHTMLATAAIMQIVGCGLLWKVIQIKV